MAFRYIQNGNPTQAFPTVDLNDGAITGDWINVALYPHFAILLTHADVAAAVTYTFQQASSIAGADNADLDLTVYYDKEGTVDLTAVGTWTRNTQAAANTVATTSGSEAMVIVEWDAVDLNPGLTFVQCSVSDPGAACPGSGVWHLMGARYAQQITDSALV